MALLTGSSAVLSNRKAAFGLSAGVVAILIASPVSAWDAQVSIGQLDNTFHAGSWTGDLNWTTIREGVRADSGPGTIPVNITYQNWDGVSWPSAMLHDEETVGGVIAQAHIDHDDAIDEYPSGASVFVFGNINPGEAFGASWLYDFQLTLAPFTFVTVVLDESGGDAFGYIQAEPGDNGIAFALAKLYSHDLALGAPGGANQPYAGHQLDLSSPPTDGYVEGALGFSHTFQNNGSTPVTYNLRLQADVLIFENVPEPATLVLLGLGALPLLHRRRAKSAR